MRFEALNKTALALLLGCSIFPPVFADAPAVADESEVLAAFLYNFALLTEWPPSGRHEFRICVLGKDPVLKSLSPIQSRKIRETPVMVTEIAISDSILECQILFVADNEHARMATIARTIGSAPVLVVSNENAYDPGNTIIALSRDRKKIRFRINQTGALQRSLTLSSKLLGLAREVY